MPGRGPGTVAAALTAAGAAVDDLDGHDWWFRCRFERPDATPDGEPAARVRRDRDRGRGVPQRRSTADQFVDVAGPRDRRRRRSPSDNELVIVCRALAAAAASPAPTQRPVADTGRQRRQPALASHDGVRTLAGLRPGARRRRSVATGAAVAAFPPCRTSPCAPASTTASGSSASAHGRPDQRGLAATVSVGSVSAPLAARRRRHAGGRTADRERPAVVAAHARRSDAVRRRRRGRRRDGHDSPDRLPLAAVPG